MTSTMNGRCNYNEINLNRCPGHREAVTSRAEVIESWPEGDPRKAWYELTRFKDEWKNTRARGADHLFRLKRLFRHKYWEQVQYESGSPVFRTFEEFCTRFLLSDPVDVLLRFQGLCGGQAPLEMLPNLLQETATKFRRAQMDEKRLAEVELLEPANSHGGDRRSEEARTELEERYQDQCNVDLDHSRGEVARQARAHLASPEWVKDLEVQNLITANLARFLGSTSVRNAEDYDQRIQAFHEAALESLPEPGASRDEITDCRRKLEQIVRTIFPSAPATVAGGPLVVRLSPSDAADTAARIASKVPGQDYLRTLVAVLASYLEGTAEPVPAAAVTAEKRAGRRIEGQSRQPYSDERVQAFAEVVRSIALTGDQLISAQACCEQGEPWDGWMAFLSCDIPNDSPITAGNQLSTLATKWPATHPQIQIRSARVEDVKRMVMLGLVENVHQAKRVYLMKVAK